MRIFTLLLVVQFHQMVWADKTQNWNYKIVDYVNSYSRKIKDALVQTSNLRVRRSLQDADNYQAFSQLLTSYTNGLKSDIASLIEDNELFGEVEEQEAVAALARITADINVPTSGSGDSMQKLILLVIDMLDQIDSYATKLQDDADSKAKGILDIIEKYRFWHYFII